MQYLDQRENDMDSGVNSDLIDLFGNMGSGFKEMKYGPVL